MERKISIMVSQEATPEFSKFLESVFQQTPIVASDGGGELASLVMCTSDQPPYYFSDDVFTKCVDCGTGIRHRPHAPKTPPKVCIGCASRRISEYHDGI